jgi:hypothetical protein
MQHPDGKSMYLWKRMGQTVSKWLREFGESFQAMAEDLRQHSVLWLAIFGAIIPAIFAALTISSNSSRLGATLEASAVLYEGKSATVRSSAEAYVSAEAYLAILAEKIGATLKERISSVFPEADNMSGSENKDIKGDNSLDRGMSFPKIKVRVRSEVTNIGNRPSSLQSVTWYAVEEIDGRRGLSDFAFQWPKNVRLLEGQPVTVLPENGETVEFALIGLVWSDYQAVRILSGKIQKEVPKGQSLLPRVGPYLDLLTLNNFLRRERILKIADPSHHCRLLYGVRVSDTYGRATSAETVWLDSNNFNRGSR